MLFNFCGNYFALYYKYTTFATEMLRSFDA